MAFEFDPAKDKRNREKHGIGLRDFVRFDSDPVIKPARTSDYGERRFRAFGRINAVPYCLVFTHRGDDLRLISLRRMHEEEMSEHEQRG